MHVRINAHVDLLFYKNHVIGVLPDVIFVDPPPFLTVGIVGSFLDACKEKATSRK